MKLSIELENEKIEFTISDDSRCPKILSKLFKLFLMVCNEDILLEILKEMDINEETTVDELKSFIEDLDYLLV